MSNNTPYTITSTSYIKMHQRGQFNITYGVSGLQPYLASKFRPNIFQVSLSAKCQGIASKDDRLANFQWYDKYFLPILSQFDEIINTMFSPADKLVVSTQTIKNAQEDSDTSQNFLKTLDTGKQTNITVIYDTLEHNFVKNYMIYYPSVKPEIAEAYTIGLQLSVNDKIQSVTETTMDI